MTATDKEEVHPEGRIPPRAVTAQPAYSPSAWPANQAALTPGKPVAPLMPPPPASFSFGDIPPASAEPASVARDAIDPDPILLPPDPSQAPRAAAVGASSLAITTTGPEAQQL